MKPFRRPPFDGLPWSECNVGAQAADNADSLFRPIAQGPVLRPELDRVETRQAPELAAPVHQFERVRGHYDAGFWRILEQLSGTAPAVAASVTPLRRHEDAWQARLDLVRSAKESLTASLYALYPDDRGFQFLEELIAARRRGVSVMVNLDSNAQMVVEHEGKPFMRDLLHNMLAELTELGGVVVYSGTLDDQVRRPGSGQHFKAIVADHERAVVGGRNIGEPYYSVWSDFDAKLTGPVVGTIEAEVLEILGHGRMGHTKGIGSSDAKAWFHDELEQHHVGLGAHADARRAALNAAVRAGVRVPSFTLIAHDPLEDRKIDKNNRVTHALVEATDRAEREIYITSNYVDGAKPLRDALIRAAKRGVAVHLVTTSEAGSRVSKMPYYVAEAHYGALLAAGCLIHEAPEQEHGKMYLFDDAVGAFGSYNTSKWSHGRNGEGLLFTCHPAVIADIKSAVLETVSTCARPAVDPGPWLRRVLRFVSGLVS